MLFLKISLPLYLPFQSRVKDQRETKDEPRNNLRTPNYKKSTFVKIFHLLYLSYTLPSSAERRAREDRVNNGTTPRQQKVLFVNICHCHWLFSARGFPREFPSVPVQSLRYIRSFRLSLTTCLVLGDFPPSKYSSTTLDGVPSRVSRLPNL